MIELPVVGEEVLGFAVDSQQTTLIFSGGYVMTITGEWTMERENG